MPKCRENRKRKRKATAKLARWGRAHMFERINRALSKVYKDAPILPRHPLLCSLRHVADEDRYFFEVGESSGPDLSPGPRHTATITAIDRERGIITYTGNAT